MAFTPKISQRGAYQFAEMFTCPGPQTLGVTGDNTYATLFGRDWLLVLDRGSNTLQLYQEHETNNGDWVEITTGLPSIFDAPLPENSRRVTLAFDQSARAIIAYEHEGVIYLTRWDEATSAYKQNVNVTGVDPCLFMDAPINLQVPGSDVLLFYRTADNPGNVWCRVQREHYGTERLMYTQEEPLILDRVQAVAWRYQLLVSDGSGNFDGQVLRSPLYPMLVQDEQTAGANFEDANYYHVRSFYEEMFVDAQTNGVNFTQGVYTSTRLIKSHYQTELPIAAGVNFMDGTYTNTRLIVSDTIEDRAVTAGVDFQDAQYHKYREFYDVEYAEHPISAGVAFTGGEHREV